MQRKFRCKGLKETNEAAWSHAFKVGDVYEEVPRHQFSKRGRLYLKGKVSKGGYQYSWFVDADQFEEVGHGRLSAKEIIWSEVKFLAPYCFAVAVAIALTIYFLL